MPTPGYKNADQMYHELCSNAGADPDRVAAVIVFGHNKPTYILSKGESRVLSLMLAMGVTVDGVTYPSTRTLWQRHEDCDIRYVRDIMGFDPKGEKVRFALHDARKFHAPGEGTVVVYTETIHPA